MLMITLRRMLMSNKMLNTNEKVNPAVLALVELGNGIGGTKVSG